MDIFVYFLVSNCISSGTFSQSSEILTTPANYSQRSVSCVCWVALASIFVQVTCVFGRRLKIDVLLDILNECSHSMSASLCTNTQL